MIKPFNQDAILKVKGKEKDLMIVDGETNGVELDNAIDFAKEGSNFFVLATKHMRVLDLN